MGGSSMAARAVPGNFVVSTERSLPSINQARLSPKPGIQGESVHKQTPIKRVRHDVEHACHDN